MENNTFSFFRFSSYLRLAFRQSGFLLRLLIASTAMFILLTSIVPYFTGTYLLSYRPDYIEGHYIDVMWLKEIHYFTIGFLIILAICANYMFYYLSTKGKRINSLLIPASNLEKFISHFILYIIGGFIIFFISAYLSDIVRVIIAPLYAPEDSYIAIMPFDYFISRGTCYDHEMAGYAGTHHDFSLQFSTFLILGGVLTLQAYFALAGILWHKHSISKGILAGICLTTLYVFTGIESVKIFDKGARMIPRFNLDNFSYFIVSVWIVTIIFVITLYVISYFRFKESESINRW